MPANGRGTWWVRAIPSLQRSAAPFAVTSWPLKTTAPASGARAPDSTFSSVVLPAPFGPTTPTASPRLSVRLTPSSTDSARKRLRTSTAASVAGPSVTIRNYPAVYGCSVPATWTFGSDEVSQITKSTGHLETPCFHCPPMIGVVCTLGIGAPANVGGFDQSRWPTIGSTESVLTVSA